MLTPMRRVDIIVPRGHAADVLRVVHRAGVVHLTEFEPLSAPGVFGREHRGRRAGPSGPFGAALRHVTELSDLLGRPRTDERLVGDTWALDDAALLARAEGLQAVMSQATAFSSELQRLRAEAARLAGYREIIEGLRRAVGHLPAIRGYGSTGIVVRARFRAVVDLIRDELEALTDGRCEVLSADIDPERTAAVLIYPLRHAAAVRSIVGARDLDEVTLPESLAAVPFDQLVPRLEAEEAAARSRADIVAADLDRVAAEHGPLVAALALVLGDRQAEALALREAGRSDHLVVIAGWLPSDRVADLQGRLATEVGPDVIVAERPVDAVEPKTPVAFSNRPVVRAFEPLASFVSLPHAGTVDPTPVVAFVVPLFVGLMVGDAGYGLVLLGLLAAARLRWRQAPLMSIVWPIGALAALSTIAFGVLFGEWFGDAGHALLGLQPIWFDRREGVASLLVLALGIGLAQVAFGLILGVVNATRLRHRREAVGRAALLGSLVAIVAGIGALSGLLPGWAGPAAAIALLAGLVILTTTLGLAGPLEVMGVLGNVLSYTRLMAIGLASVMLAMIANRMGGLVESVLVGAVIAATFHVLAFVLGFFDASVQGLRLQYVEFFSKFAEPSGVRYEPFMSVLGAPDRALRSGA
jgi:V/A-type H+/Na+-transporting ATPase subunit I